MKEVTEISDRLRIGENGLEEKNLTGWQFVNNKPIEFLDKEDYSTAVLITVIALATLLILCK